MCTSPPLLGLRNESSPLAPHQQVPATCTQSPLYLVITSMGSQSGWHGEPHSRQLQLSTSLGCAQGPVFMTSLLLDHTSSPDLSCELQTHVHGAFWASHWDIQWALQTQQARNNSSEEGAPPAVHPTGKKSTFPCVFPIPTRFNQQAYQ